MGNLLAPQPPPMAAEGDVWADTIAYYRGVASPGLLADMAARRAFGIGKHGTPLQAGNLRDACADAYQEVLDGIVYSSAQMQQLLCAGRLDASEAWGDIRHDLVLLAERIRLAPSQDPARDPTTPAGLLAAAGARTPDALLPRLALE
jgi:hypothetical protein